MRIAEAWAIPILLLALALLLFLPGLGDGYLWEGRELAYAEAAREMRLTGEYFHIQRAFATVWDEPPLFAWLQASAYSFWGLGSWAARAPSALAGCLFGLSLFFLGRSLHGAAFGLLWALAGLCTLQSQFIFRTGIPDGFYYLFFGISVAFMAIASGRTATGGHAGFAALSGLFLGLVVLLQGLTVLWLMVPLLLSYWVWNGLRPVMAASDIAIMAISLFLTAAAWFAYEFAYNGPQFFQAFSSQPQPFADLAQAGKVSIWQSALLVLVGFFPLWLFVVPNFARQREKDPTDFRRWMALLFGLSLVFMVFTKEPVATMGQGLLLPLSYLAAFHLYQLLVRGTNIDLTTWVLLGVVAAGIGGSMLVMGIWLGYYPWHIVAMFSDVFLKTALEGPSQYTGLEGLAGLVIILAVGLAYLMARRSTLFPALIVLLVGSGLGFSLCYNLVAARASAQVEGPAASFYANTAKEGKRAHPYGYAGLGHLYYANAKPSAVPVVAIDSASREWFLADSLAGPTYLAVRVGYFPLRMGTQHLEFLAAKGGYRFYKKWPGAGARARASVRPSVRTSVRARVEPKASVDTTADTSTSAGQIISK